MKTLLAQTKTLFLLTLAVFGYSNSFSQTIPIPRTFFGINYWYYEETNAFNPTAPLEDTEYTDYFAPKMAILKHDKIKMVRIGGSKYNKDWTTVDHWPLYDRAIDSVVAMGGTPILQVPINLIEFQLGPGIGDTTLTPTTASLAFVQAWVDHFNGTKGIKYWAIGNEPDPSARRGFEDLLTQDLDEWRNGARWENGNTYKQFVVKFKRIARVIKRTSSTDIVVGPDFRHFWGGPNETNTPLANGFYYEDFIDEVGTATVGNVPNGVPLLDIFTFHYYGYSMTPDKASDFETVKGYIDAANLNRREGSDLSLAMGEVNADPNDTDSDKPKPWDFAAGQFLAFCAKNIMKNSGEFICPWSVYESDGDRDLDSDGDGIISDFSLFDSNESSILTVSRRSTMWHLTLLARNKRGYYMESSLESSPPDTDFDDLINVVGMTDQNGSTVMIMNPTDMDITYSAKLDNIYSTAAGVDVKIKFASTNSNPTEWNETIPANTTFLYTVSNTGTRSNRTEYNATMSRPRTIILPPEMFPSAAVNPNLSSSASTYAIEGNDKVNLYPIPILDNLNVDNATNFKSIQIYNNVGQVVYTVSNPNQSKLNIDFSRMAPGIYYIHLKGESGTVVKRVIKN